MKSVSVRYLQKRINVIEIDLPQLEYLEWLRVQRVYVYYRLVPTKPKEEVSIIRDFLIPCPLEDNPPHFIV